MDVPDKVFDALFVFVDKGMWALAGAYLIDALGIRVIAPLVSALS